MYVQEKLHEIPLVFFAIRLKKWIPWKMRPWKQALKWSQKLVHTSNF